MDLNTVYYTNGTTELAYLEIGEYLVPSFVGKEILHVSDTQIKGMIKHPNIFELRFHVMLKQLQSGKKLSNFKSSKYYQYYLERLKEDYPEYLV